MSITMNRRKFLLGTVAAGAAGVAASAVSMKTFTAADLNPVVAILKRRLPNVKFDQVSVEKYAQALLQRFNNPATDADKRIVAAFRPRANDKLFEHLVVQDFLTYSDTLRVAHLQQPVRYLG